MSRKKCNAKVGSRSETMSLSVCFWRSVLWTIRPARARVSHGGSIVPSAGIDRTGGHVPRRLTYHVCDPRKRVGPYPPAHKFPWLPVAVPRPPPPFDRPVPFPLAALACIKARLPHIIQGPWRGPSAARPSIPLSGRTKRPGFTTLVDASKYTFSSSAQKAAAMNNACE
ncbi:hypothetical protein K437DRAFT_16001 [Tilletiaria anomala UBC 951]|uniref:Uncharacterized protein n=1 Tax=Tilletiaria anomala (strain ATCC 24038 / CBS 436.72 / UBC 951) TaxID=1037660 RepID=A0A066WEZ4_TILAU|nr:uncharacterized protein K437DRAFT_16001 [Tilletiaria anomala UBC 951]KDN52321.1 hypothetical protein K437DRAFT_16001 [Tilletiaria anomala UBC 951]